MNGPREKIEPERGVIDIFNHRYDACRTNATGPYDCAALPIVLFRLAVRQDKLGKALRWFAFDIGKRGHSHAAFLNFLNNRVLVCH